MEDLLKRPEIRYKDLVELEAGDSPDSTTSLRSVRKSGTVPSVAQQVEIQIKYQGYINRQMVQVERFRKMEKMRIPDDVDYSEVPSISREVRDKLCKIRPLSIGQASRISGVTPAALSILMVYLKGRAQKGHSHSECEH